mgnify:FL=1
MKKGLIISFEGIDGCGKSTQAKLFEKYLKENGEKTILLYEPGGTVIGEKIRKLLLNNKSNIDKWTELFLYLASRSQLLQEKIKKEKDSGSIIILDRYIYSTIAYQGYGRGIPEKLIMTIHKYFIDKYFPDITFVIDVKPESVISVLNKKKKDRIENESIQFQRKVREGYLKISKSLNNVKVIKRKTIEKTHMEIIETWEKFKDEYRRH